MKITWHGHACFTLESADGTIVFDPYQDYSVPGFKPLRLKADKVLCSHEHSDHNAKDVVTISPNEKKFKITMIPSYHDDQNGTLRGNNIIHIIDMENQKVVHLGDLGHTLNAEQLAVIKNCDVLMIPVGGHYTIDGKTAYEIVKEVNAKVIIPMHYRSANFGYDVISTLDSFTQYFDDYKVYESNWIEIDQNTSPHIAILSI